MGFLQWIVENGDKIGVVTLLLVFFLAWAFEFIMLGKTYNRTVREKNADIARANERADLAEARSERLLTHLEKATRVTEDMATIATVTQVRRGDVTRRRSDDDLT